MIFMRIFYLSLILANIVIGPVNLYEYANDRAIFHLYAGLLSFPLVLIALFMFRKFK